MSKIRWSTVHCSPMTTSQPTRTELPVNDLEARVDRLALAGQDREHELVDLPQPGTLGDRVQRRQPETLLTQRETAFAAQPALAQPGQPIGFQVVGTVDDPQVLAAA